MLTIIFLLLRTHSLYIEGNHEANEESLRRLWAGQYMPDKYVAWVPNSEVAVSSEADLCGHSCGDGIGLFGWIVCKTTWETGCPGEEPPEGVTPDTVLRTLCPDECAEAEKTANAEAEEEGDGTLKHISVFLPSEEGQSNFDMSKVRIELKPYPNPNRNKAGSKKKRDHRCDCRSCPPRVKPTLDPKKLARAKNETETTTPALDKPELQLAGDSFEGGEGFQAGEAEKKRQAEMMKMDPKKCPQCCLEVFKSGWDHVIFHDLKPEKQDKPEMQLGSTYLEEEEEWH